MALGTKQLQSYSCVLLQDHQNRYQNNFTLNRNMKKRVKSQTDKERACASALCANTWLLYRQVFFSSLPCTDVYFVVRGLNFDL